LKAAYPKLCRLFVCFAFSCNILNNTNVATAECMQLMSFGCYSDSCYVNAMGFASFTKIHRLFATTWSISKKYTVYVEVAFLARTGTYSIIQTFLHTFDHRVSNSGHSGARQEVGASHLATAGPCHLRENPFRRRHS